MGNPGKIRMERVMCIDMNTTLSLSLVEEAQAEQGKRAPLVLKA